MHLPLLPPLSPVKSAAGLAAAARGKNLIAPSIFRRLAAV
jgi:hypothetical protein